MFVLLKDEYHALLDKHPTRDSNQFWLDAIKNVETGSSTKRKKRREVFGVGFASQIIYPLEPTDNPSSMPAQPDYDAIIQQMFVYFEAWQMEFNNRL